MVRYYRENDTGDFMAVWFNRELRCPDGTLTARSTAIAQNPSSVCTCSVARDYLKEKCTPVLKTKVPKAWLSRF